jgi:hypothetical protein
MGGGGGERPEMTNTDFVYTVSFESKPLQFSDFRNAPVLPALIILALCLAVWWVIARRYGSKDSG